MVKLLIDGGANIAYSERSTGMTALMMLCHLESEDDSLAIADAILEQDCSEVINLQDIGLNSALHHAVMTSKVEICKLLIEKGADLTLKNRDSMLAIDLANKKEKELL